MLDLPPSDVFLMIDFPDRCGRKMRRVYKNPVDILTAISPGEVISVLEAVQDAARNGLTAVGYVAYEAAPALDPRLSVRDGCPVPLVAFGIFESARHEADEVGANPADAPLWTLDTYMQEYAALIKRTHNAIRRGDTYQVNLTLRARARFSGDAQAYYEQIRGRQQAPYSAYLSFGAYRILSVSPELFFRMEDGCVTTRPVKGTAPRGITAEEDARLGAALTASEKNRAENVMIVDLLRSDIGRIAEYGSVQVEELCALERFPTFQQLASEISGTLRSGADLVDIFKALFPCGSVTGAPKRRTMDYIAELESAPRGVYCGAIGMVEPGGRAVFSVAIRTTTIDTAAGTAVTGLGSGVTWDSNASDEYAEIQLKSRYLNPESERWSLLETMLLRDGKYALLDEHLERLANSARHFRFAFRPEEIKTKLEETAANADGPQRVRLTLDKNGEARIEQYALDALPEKPVVGLSDDPMPCASPWIVHKTTKREEYERRLAACPGVYDVLLQNTRGELTEFTRGNVVVEMEGELVTPPVSSGLLNGTFRRSLIRKGKIEERLLNLQDLKQATRLWFINSVRGWVEVEMSGSDRLLTPILMEPD